MLVRVGVTPKAPDAKHAFPAQEPQSMAPCGSGAEQLLITTASPSFGGASTPGVGGTTLRRNTHGYSSTSWYPPEHQRIP